MYPYVPPSDDVLWTDYSIVLLFINLEKPCAALPQQ